MTHHYVVSRMQETVVDVDDYQMDEGEDPRLVALEIAVDCGEWDTVSLDAEPADG